MRRTSYILAFDFLFLILCGLGVYRFSQKARFPAVTERFGSALVISASNDTFLKSGDTLIAINNLHIASDNETQFLCNQYRIGDTIEVSIHRNGKALTLSAILVSDYPLSKILLETFAAFIFFILGVGVLLLQKKEKPARIFHHLSISIAVLILLTTGRYTIAPIGLGYALEILFYITYVMVPVLFLHFTFIFPHEKLRDKRKFLVPTYIIASILALWSGITFLQAAYPSVDLNKYNAYSISYSAVLIFFTALFFGGFGNLLHSYRHTNNQHERSKLRWIFFGIASGPSAYIFLSLLPTIITGKDIDEELAIGLSVIAPISFAIAIIRFRLFDIELLFKRSTAYTIVIVLLLSVYLGIVWLVTQLVFALNLPPALPDIFGAILIALLFEPLRRGVQKFIDKKFFRVPYNFHEVQHGFFEEIKFVSTKISLANLVTERIDGLLQVSKVGFFVVESPTDKLRLIAHHNFDLLERRNIQLEKRDLKTGLELPVALDEKIEPGIEFESADALVFKRWGMALVLPMLSSNRNILGFLVLGEKLSGKRFSIEDIALLTSVSTQAGLSLERLKVEYSLMLEQAESERLNELNRLKSYFVSSVSHDLKTPLTSIRLFAEFLKEHENIPRQKAMEYFGIIEGEADRLSRLINSVLDFAKIEKGTKEYYLELHNLNEIVQNVIHSLDYQITSRGFAVHSNIHHEQLSIEADSDAIFDALTNLISNAMKYSPPDKKNISIYTKSEAGYAILSVTDEGYGIPEHELDKIFESFYRIDDPRMKSAGGAGLGLSLVKHTMDAHRGKIEVRSEVGKGSIFALYFPIIPHEENTDR